MKALAQRVQTHPKYAKALEWGKLISITGSAQVLVQAIGFVSGILVIRLLPTHEYGLYTLANTMLGTMTVLADGGITNGVMAQGGKVWQDKEKLGRVLATGIILRKKFALGSLLVALPLLLYLLQQHGASWLMSMLLVASLVPAFFTGLSGALFQVPPKIWQDIAALQKTEIGVSAGRLVMVAFTLFVFPWAFVAVLAAGLPQIWANLRLRRISSAYADWAQKPDPVVQKEILALVRRTLPGAIYYCVSGQLTIWLISLFGTTAALAQMGALGRLAMLFSPFSVLFATLVAPRFARMPAEPYKLLARFMQLSLGLLLLFVSIVGTVSFFSSEILWVLGKGYHGLDDELKLSITGNSLTVLAGAFFALCTSRAWMIHPFISMPINIISTVCGILLFDVSSLQGVLMFNIFVAVIQVLMNGGYCFLKISKAVYVS